MRIGICTFGGDGGKSGISRYIMSLLREFATGASGHEFDVVVYGDERSIFVPEHAAGMEAIEYPERLRPPVRNIWWHQASLPGLCRRRGWDVAFLPAANRRTALRLPCPMAGTVHDFSSIHVAAKYDPARMFYIRRVLPFLARRLDHVLTVSGSSRRDIIDFARVPPDRVTVTPLAADHEAYKPGDHEAAQGRIADRYRIPLPYVLYTSRLEHPGKNHVRLIEAFAKLKAEDGIPHHLVLAGSEWSGSEAVHAFAQEQACADAIHFPGFVAGEDLPALYQGADAFVFPSLYEGFGLPILEAMACGTPTACSNISSMPEVAGDAAPVFDPYDADAIAGVLRRLLLDEAHREERRRLGIERARQFQWARTAKETLLVLESIAR